MYFAGWTLSCVFVPRFADKTGRKTSMLLSYLVVLLCLASTMVSTSLAFTTFVMFVMGLTASGVATVSFVYILECMPPEWRSTAGSWNNIVAFSLPVLYALFFRFLSSYYIYILWFGFINTTVSVLVLHFYLDESAEFLLKNGQIDQAS